MRGHWRHFFGFDPPGYWRMDLTGLCLLTVMGLFLRTVVYRNAAIAGALSLLLEPVALLLVLTLRAIFSKLHIDIAFTIRSIATIIALSVAAAFVHTLWGKLIIISAGWFVPAMTSSQNWAFPWTYYSMIFVAWSLAHFWVAAESAAQAERQRAILAEAEALKAELHHLRHQLDPHFLFNALNGIVSGINKRPKTAAAMGRKLAEYMRYSLEHRDLAVAPLSRELEGVRSYLDVQKTRFGRDLRFHISIDDGAGERKTPGFLLQPLVENAVKHGFKDDGRAVDIAIEAQAEGDLLSMSVTAAGTLQPDWQSAGNPGVGLSVLRRRLELFYPERHRFTLSQVGDKVRAELSLKGEACSV